MRSSIELFLVLFREWDYVRNLAPTNFFSEIFQYSSFPKAFLLLWFYYYYFRIVIWKYRFLCHLMWKTFCHFYWANSTKTNLWTCNLWTKWFVSYKSLNLFWLIYFCHCLSNPQNFNPKRSELLSVFTIVKGDFFSESTDGVVISSNKQTWTLNFCAF